MKILFQDGAGVRALEEGFASEYELQIFLRDHATLIPMDDIRIGTPPLLCIGWEVFAASGSEDLLYVDETGLLTVVETKLGRNPESRRKVVGQILEYAAQTVSWSKAEVESRANTFLSSQDCPDEYRGKSLEEALRQFFEDNGSPRLEGFSYGEYLESVERNLASGHIRLIIAVDKPPDPLRKIVDFVNRFSEHFEMYLFQLRRFRDEATKSNIFVPELFGQVPTRPPQRKVWDEKTLLEDAQAKHSPAEAALIQRLLEFAHQDGAVNYGTGANGSFAFRVPGAKPPISLFIVYNTYGVQLGFGALRWRGIPEKITLEWLNQIKDISGIDIPEDSKYPTIPFSPLMTETGLAKFQQSVRSVVQKTLEFLSFPPDNPEANDH